MNDTPQLYHARLKEARERAGLTITDIARSEAPDDAAAGLQETLELVERGEATPPEYYLKILASRYRIPVEAFYSPDPIEDGPWCAEEDETCPLRAGECWVEVYTRVRGEERWYTPHEVTYCPKCGHRVTGAKP